MSGQTDRLTGGQDGKHVGGRTVGQWWVDGQWADRQVDFQAEVLEGEPEAGCVEEWVGGQVAGWAFVRVGKMAGRTVD